MASTNVEGCVQSTGAWNGVVTINCPEALACKFTDSMYHLTPGSVGQEELQDALGEMTNMIGGNIKSLMFPSCHISLPIVAIGGHLLHFPMTETACKITMKCLGQLFQVTILRQKKSRFSTIKYQ